MASKRSMPPRGTPSMFGDRYSDLLIICDRHQLPGHCVIVCNASNYFASKVNLAHDVNKKAVIYINDGIDAATALRAVYWLYNKSADNDDNKLDLHAVEQKGPSSLGSYGLPEPRLSVASNGKYQGAQADLMDLQESQASSNALAVLTNDMQKLNISAPFFTDETTSEMWVWLRLHRAAMLFEIPGLAEECIANMSNICNGSAYAADFVKFIHRLHDAAHLDIPQDGPSHVIANECAMNIEYLLDDGEFANFLRERDGFSYLIIQKLKERYEAAAAIAAEERPRLLLTSPEDDVADGALLRLGDDVEEYQHRNTQLTAELDAAKVDIAAKHQQVSDVSDRLEKTQQDLANANDKMAQLKASTSTAVVKKGRGTFTDLGPAREPSAMPVLDDVRRKQAKKITDLEGSVANLTNDLNQARLGRDEFRNNTMTTNDNLEKENKKLRVMSEQAFSAAKTASLASAASAERVNKLEQTLALRNSSDEAAALDTLENKDLKSNINGLKTYIAGLESEVAGLKAEVSSKDAKFAQLPTERPLSLLQPSPLIQPRPRQALSQASSECAVRSPSPSPSLTTAGSVGSIAPGSHGGVMTFAEKQIMMQRRRQMTAGVAPQQVLLSSNVSSSSSQSLGTRTDSAAQPSQTNRVQLQQITQTNGAVPSQTNGSQSSQTNGVVPAQINGIAAAQTSVKKGPVTAVAPAVVLKDDKVTKPVQDENVDPTRRMLGPHHAAGSSAGPLKPKVAAVSSSSTQGVVEEVSSMKLEMDKMKKTIMTKDAQITKLTNGFDFVKRQLTDARTGPMSTGSVGRSGDLAGRPLNPDALTFEPMQAIITPVTSRGPTSTATLLPINHNLRRTENTNLSVHSSQSALTREPATTVGWMSAFSSAASPRAKVPGSSPSSVSAVKQRFPVGTCEIPEGQGDFVTYPLYTFTGQEYLYLT